LATTFAGRAAIVTGAGGGLGRAYAHLLAERGARVMVNDFFPERAEQTVSEIAAGGGIAVANGDPVSAAGSMALYEAAVRDLGNVDILIANAGTTTSTASLPAGERSAPRLASRTPPLPTSSWSSTRTSSAITSSRNSSIRVCASAGSGASS